MLPTLYQEAIDYSNEGDYAAALIIWEQHYQRLYQDTDVIERYYVHYYLAEALNENGQILRATELLKQALKILPKNKGDLILSTNVEICRLLVAQSRFVEADEIRNIFWSKLLQETRLYEAYHTALDKYVQIQKEGEVLLEEVLATALKTKELIFLDNYYREYAAQFLSQRKFNDIIKLSQTVRDLLANDVSCQTFQTTIAFTYLNELEVHYQRRDYSALKILLVEARNLLRLPHPNEESVTVMAHFYEAIEALFDEKISKALSLLKQVEQNATFDEEFHLNALEKSYQALTDFYFYDQALPIANRAIELANNLSDDYSKLDIVVDKAQIHESANHFKKAIETLLPIESRVIAHEDEELIQRYYSLLTKAAEQVPDAKIFAYARNRWVEFSEKLPDHLAFDFCFDYAQILISLNQTEQAFDLYDRAERIANKLEWDHHLPNIYIEKAICEARLNRYQDSYRRLTEMKPPVKTIHLYTTYLNLLGDCQQELDMLQKAKANYYKVIDLIAHHEHLFHHASTSYSNLGLIEHTSKNYFKAEQLYLKGLEIDEKTGITQQEITSYYNLGVLYVDWMKYGKAETHLWTALQLISNTFDKSDSPSDQKHISDEWFTIIELLVEVFVEKGEELMALRLLLNKHVALRGLNKHNLRNLPLPYLRPEQQLLAYSGIRQKRLFVFQLYPSQSRQPIKLRTIKIDLDKTDLQVTSPSLWNTIERYRKRVLKNIGERDKNYQSPYPWMVRYLHFLAARAERFQTIKSISIRKKLLKELSKMLIIPLGDLSEFKQLIIAPNYILGALPFGALFTDEKESYRLIEQYDVSIFGGITESSKNHKDHNTLIFGATKYAHATKLTDLPAAEKEIENITTLFPYRINKIDDPSSDIIEKINKEILENHPAYLHYIGHAESKYPESVLYYPYAREGVITVSEIKNLHLSGITVFLSACSSANGLAYAGWGIDSIARSFFNAGATTVISLLFPLSDELSPLLVKLFYSSVKLGASPEAALSALQKACVTGVFGKSYQQIQCWASLICIKRFAALNLNDS